MERHMRSAGLQQASCWSGAHNDCWLWEAHREGQLAGDAAMEYHATRPDVGSSAETQALRLRAMGVAAKAAASTCMITSCRRMHAE